MLLCEIDMENNTKVTNYNHPYTVNGIKDEPIFLNANNIGRFIYPDFGLDYSDLDYMYLSTEEITICRMEVAPGGFFDPPDCHPGDEAYYVLEGVVTLLNPKIGQCVEVHAGEAVLIPKGALHSGYNFGDKTLKVLAIIAPKHIEEEGKKTILDGPKKIFKYNPADFSGKSQAWEEPRIYGNVDCLGTWPIVGSELRQAGIIYRIAEDKKLIVIHGEKRPLLIKYSVSNDCMHVGEYILPAGGTTTRHSEVISHGGQSMLYGVEGPMTVFLPKDRVTYVLNANEGLYLPPNTEYRLLNYGDKTAKVLFAIAKDL